MNAVRMGHTSCTIIKKIAIASLWISMYTIERNHISQVEICRSECIHHVRYNSTIACTQKYIISTKLYRNTVIKIS